MLNTLINCLVQNIHFKGSLCITLGQGSNQICFIQIQNFRKQIVTHTAMNLDTGKLGKHRCLSHVPQTLARRAGEIVLQFSSGQIHPIV